MLFCHTRTRERARVAHRHHPGDPGSRPGKSPLARSTQRMPSGLSGTGEGNLPVKSPSPRIPARRPGLQETLRRFSAGLPLPQPSSSPECGTGVESPLKSANRRPDDKGWTPGMAARGESRQDVELSRPQAAGREVSAVRSTDFVAGPRGLIRGPRWPPYHVHGFRNVIFCWS